MRLRSSTNPEEEGFVNLYGLEQEQRGADWGIPKCRLQVQPLIHQELASNPGISHSHINRQGGALGPVAWRVSHNPQGTFFLLVCLCPGAMLTLPTNTLVP